MIFFEKNDFKDYWLIDGTLMGFIRDNGPIPYDYDLDIAVGKADFERLSKFLDENPKILSEQNLRWDNHYYRL